LASGSETSSELNGSMVVIVLGLEVS